jgi:hypothetical protein
MLILSWIKKSLVQFTLEFTGWIPNLHSGFMSELQSLFVPVF